MQLVYREFAKHRYVDPNSASWKELPKHNLHPTSATFVARYRHRVVGTISVILDSEIGLPLDDTYKEEIDKLRQQNRKICQFTQLAVDRTFLKFRRKEGKRMSQLFVFVPLFKLSFQYCALHAVDYFVMTINPKHESFYKNVMMCHEVGDSKRSPALNHAPTSARGCHVQEAMSWSHKSRIWAEILVNPPSSAILLGQEVSAETS